MRPELLFIYVEGQDDEDFFEEVLLKEIKNQNKYDNIVIKRWAQKNKVEISKDISRNLKLKHKVVFVTDNDNLICFSSRKDKLISLFNPLSEEIIFIAKQEIESWYYAGLDDEFLGNNKLKMVKNTDSITKEKLNLILKSSKYKSNLNLIIRNDMLNHFSIETAKVRNQSFYYFCNKFNI